MIHVYNLHMYHLHFMLMIYQFIVKYIVRLTDEQKKSLLEPYSAYICLRSIEFPFFDL